jgi:hypothetical protein
MKKITTILAFAVVLMAVKCEKQIPLPIPTPVNPDDGTADDCPAACENLVRLGCDGAGGSPGLDEAFGTMDDVPCAEVCAYIMNTPPATVRPKCVSKASSCKEVDACFE